MRTISVRLFTLLSGDYRRIRLHHADRRTDKSAGIRKTLGYRQSRITAFRLHKNEMTEYMNMTAGEPWYRTATTNRRSADCHPLHNDLIVTTLWQACFLREARPIENIEKKAASKIDIRKIMSRHPGTTFNRNHLYHHACRNARLLTAFGYSEATVTWWIGERIQKRWWAAASSSHNRLHQHNTPGRKQRDSQDRWLSGTDRYTASVHVQIECRSWPALQKPMKSAAKIYPKDKKKWKREFNQRAYPECDFFYRKQKGKAAASMTILTFWKTRSILHQDQRKIDEMSLRETDKSRHCYRWLAHGRHI